MVEVSNSLNQLWRWWNWWKEKLIWCASYINLAWSWEDHLLLLFIYLCPSKYASTESLKSQPLLGSFPPRAAALENSFPSHGSRKTENKSTTTITKTGNRSCNTIRSRREKAHLLMKFKGITSVLQTRVNQTHNPLSFWPNQGHYTPGRRRDANMPISFSQTWMCF